jgi:transposase
MKFCGIDWANDHHDALSIDEQGRQLGSIRVAHTPERLQQLHEYLQKIADGQSQEQVACVIETTHGLLISFLLERGWPVYPVNPRTVDRHRAPSGAKTDTIDAYLLAKTGRADFADLRRLSPDSKAQIAEVETLLKQQRYPGARAAASRMVAQLQQPALQANEVTTRTKSRLLLAILDQLEPLVKQIAAYDKEIERLFFQHEDHERFLALPGAGGRLAPRLLAEIGDDRSRYPSAQSLQALAGTSPVLYQSGTYAKAHRRLGCIKPLRNAFQQFAFHSTRSEPWAKQYYLRKRAEGKSHTVAVRALANVWVRILFAVWSKKENYEASTFEAAQHAHAQPRRAA